MKGQNKLHLNQATMIEAVQKYLDEELTNDVEVLDVQQSSTGTDTVFIVHVAEPGSEGAKEST